MEGYRKAETLIKRAGMKDYYKILDVSRSASQKEIKKAYRKMAQVCVAFDPFNIHLYLGVSSRQV